MARNEFPHDPADEVRREIKGEIYDTAIADSARQARNAADPEAMTVREVYLLTLRNANPDERIRDVIASQSEPAYNATGHALPTVAEALSGLFSSEEVTRFGEDASFQDLWPVLDELPQVPSPIWDDAKRRGHLQNENLAGVMLAPGQGREIEAGAETVSGAVGEAVDAVVKFASRAADVVFSAFTGEGPSPPRMTAKERQEARMQALHETEAQQRSEREARAGQLDRSGQSQGRDESRNRGGGISI